MGNDALLLVTPAPYIVVVVVVVVVDDVLFVCFNHRRVARLKSKSKKHFSSTRAFRVNK